MTDVRRFRSRVLGFALATVVGLGLFATTATASGNTKKHVVPVKLTVTGAQVLHATDPPPTPDADGTVPFPGTTTWTWAAKALGKGPAEVRVDVVAKAGTSVSGTGVLDAGKHNTLQGTLQAPQEQPPSLAAACNEPVTQVGRACVTVGSFTVTGGTGRFKSASGTLNGKGTATTTAFDPATGVNRTIVFAYRGKITLR